MKLTRDFFCLSSAFVFSSSVFHNVIDFNVIYCFSQFNVIAWSNYGQFFADQLNPFSEMSSNSLCFFLLNFFFLEIKRATNPLIGFFPE